MNVLATRKCELGNAQKQERQVEERLWFAFACVCVCKQQAARSRERESQERLLRERRERVKEKTDEFSQ